jgi:hypothetical protein
VTLRHLTEKQVFYGAGIEHSVLKNSTVSITATDIQIQMLNVTFNHRGAVIEQVVSNKSSLLLKNISQNTNITTIFNDN